MKIKIAFFLFATLLNFNGLSQKKAIVKKPFPPSPPPPPSLNEPWLFCKYIPKYKASDRLKFYPFNKAEYVRIISFKEKVFTDTTNLLVTSLREKALTRKKFLPSNLISNLSEQPKVFESYLLNKSDIKSLTNLLYNHSFSGRKYEEETMCYIPRNAIIFYDDRGFAFEWIEICFECLQYKKTSAKVQTGDFCIGKYELLHNFFKQHGIKYGIYF